MKCWCSPGFHSGWPHFLLSAYLRWANTMGCSSNRHPASLIYFLLAESTPLNWGWKYQITVYQLPLQLGYGHKIQAWIMGPQECSTECSEKSFSPWQKREITERLSLCLPAFKCNVKFNAWSNKICCSGSAFPPFSSLVTSTVSTGKYALLGGWAVFSACFLPVEYCKPKS